MADDFAHYAHEFLDLYFPDTHRPFYKYDGGLDRDIYDFLESKYSYVEIDPELVKRVRWSILMCMRRPDA